LGVKTVACPEVTATQARQKLNSLLPYLDKLLCGAEPDFVNQVRTAHRDPEVTFEAFSQSVHSCLAEEAGFGQNWDTTALPPAETASTLPEAPTEEDLDAQALASLAYLNGQI